MAREYPRSRRVAQQIQRLLSDIIKRELKDPRLTSVTLTDVKVSNDLGHARVFFSLLEDDTDTETVRKLLQGVEGMLRGYLGKAMKIRHVPELRFFYDDSVEKGIRLTALIDRAVASDDRKKEQDH